MEPNDPSCPIKKHLDSSSGPSTEKEKIDTCSQNETQGDIQSHPAISHNDATEK